MVGGTYAFVIFMLRCHKVKCKPPVYIDYNEFPSCGWAISIRNNQHSLFIKRNLTTKSHVCDPLEMTCHLNNDL